MCMYVYVCVCIYIYIYICVCIYVFTCIYMDMYVCVYIYIYICIFIVFVFLYICILFCFYVGFFWVNKLWCSFRTRPSIPVFVCIIVLCYVPCCMLGKINLLLLYSPWLDKLNYIKLLIYIYIKVFTQVPWILMYSSFTLFWILIQKVLIRLLPYLTYKFNINKWEGRCEPRWAQSDYWSLIFIRLLPYFTCCWRIALVWEIYFKIFIKR